MSTPDDERQAAILAVIQCLAPPVCPRREDALEVLVPVTAALLREKDDAYVSAYFGRIIAARLLLDDLGGRRGT